MDDNQLDTLIDLRINFTKENILNEKFDSIDTPKVSQDNIVQYDNELIIFVNLMLEQAIKQSASDIHIEPYAQTCRIRFRCDGLLYEKKTISNEFALRIITRLKVLAKLDITEHRFPQDGRLQYHNTDIRINSCSTLYGEKIVLRLLDSKNQSIAIHSLGLSAVQKSLFINKISSPQGMIIVTGPTSSGKTVTLYSALNHLNRSEKNITTLEDPVEIRLDGINQISVNSKINLDFSTLLRAILRQDPDIIMIGEIRDKETAEIAIQASTTGHLVLCTLHTHSAADAITRLISLGIPPFQLSHAVSLIVAQRLIRKLCPHCKRPSLSETGVSTIFHANGCRYCLGGYLGRTGIFEFLPIDNELSTHILNGMNSQLIKEYMFSMGHLSLSQSANEKIKSGITSLSEIQRVLSS